MQSQRATSDAQVASNFGGLQSLSPSFPIDIAEYERRQRPLRTAQKLEALAQFAAGFAHDFNNLLAVVQGYSSLISQSAGASEEVRKFAKSIVTAAERGGHLTQQLMLFGGRQAMEFAELDLNELVRETTPLLKKVFGSSITLSVHYTSEQLFFRGDRKMIQQVLLTIATNAKDAMSAGGSFTVTTQPHVDWQSRRVGRITLVDTGCGMDEQSLDKVFEPFFTTRAVGRGSGLGLCSAYGIIKRHEGSIEVSSQPGAGTTFDITLPLCDPVVAPEKKTRPAVSDGSGETILIVDDEEDLRFMVQNVLEGFGYQVFSAGNGVEAWSVWEQHRDSIDLLLTDMVMPEGMSGWQLAAKLRSDRSDLKVVYTSGYSVDLIADATEELVEGQNFVQKPYQPKTLAETLRRALSDSAGR